MWFELTMLEERSQEVIKRRETYHTTLQPPAQGGSTFYWHRVEILTLTLLMLMAYTEGEIASHRLEPAGRKAASNKK
jgi:hypothetical protein